MDHTEDDVNTRRLDDSMEETPARRPARPQRIKPEKPPVFVSQRTVTESIAKRKIPSQRKVINYIID